METKAVPKNDDRLKLYIICSHVDKPLEQEPPVSVYEHMIQAGAALTDRRICELNDHDGFPESISDRNARYSEATAMWWIRKHLDTPYVGIGHYRRRLKLTDEEIAGYMDDGIDIITSVPQIQQWSIEQDYRTIQYSADWDLFMDILAAYAPEDAAFAREEFAADHLYGCNVNILKSDLYREYCDWAFPIMDAFFRRSPEKTDVYLKRDVGFIAERLTHLFVRKAIVQGKKVAEAELVLLKSADSCTTDEIRCDTRDPEEVYRECDRLYREHHIGKCAYLLAEAREQNALDERLEQVEEVLGVAQMESDHLPRTMHDYLPAELRTDLNTLVRSYSELQSAVRQYCQNAGSAEAGQIRDTVERTHFSDIVLACICGLDGAEQEMTGQVIRAAHGQ